MPFVDRAEWTKQVTIDDLLIALDNDIRNLHEEDSELNSKDKPIAEYAVLANREVISELAHRILECMQGLEPSLKRK